MAKEGCIFCRIVNKELPSYKIYEDKEVLAFLDIFPNIQGQTLVIPKKHIDSYVFDVPDNDLKSFIMETKKVAKMLQKRLDVGRVNLVFEGLGVNHLHAKLYPAVGTESRFTEIVAEERTYFESYPGFVTTILGPRASDEDLKALQKKITGK